MDIKAAIIILYTFQFKHTMIKDKKLQHHHNEKENIKLE